MNVHDSEKVIGTLVHEGYRQVETVEQADLVLYNTCSIRDKAEQKVFNRLADYKKLLEAGQEVWRARAAWRSRKAKRFSSARRTFRWCADRRRTATCRRCWCNWKAPGRSREVRKPEAGSRSLVRITGLDDRETDECFETEFTARTNPHRGYITIIEGCDKFCAYCVVPYTRGKERSRTSESVLAEARQMADLGYTEIQLLGQNVNSYKDPAGKSGCKENVRRIAGRGGRSSRHPARALHHLASARLRTRHRRGHRRRAHALRSRSPAGAERIDRVLERHAAPLHPRAISGTHRLDEGGEARNQHHHRRDRRLSRRDRSRLRRDA